MSVADELDKLKKLRDAGTITDEQYERARAKLLDEAHDEKREETSEEEERRPARKTREEEDERDEEERRPRRRPRERDLDDDDDYEERRPSPRRKKKAREMCMILHLSLLAGHVVVFGGIIAPIVIWQTQKDEYPEVDAHGRNAVNWLITWILYMALSAVLAFVIVGIPLLIIGAIAGIVCPIIAGLKANEGKVWKYPLAIPFLR